jgi:hypothetical protein
MTIENTPENVPAALASDTDHDDSEDLMPEEPVAAAIAAAIDSPAVQVGLLERVLAVAAKAGHPVALFTPSSTGYHVILSDDDGAVDARGHGEGTSHLAAAEMALENVLELGRR